MKFKTSEEMYSKIINDDMKMKTLIAWKNIKLICDEMDNDGAIITIYSVGNRLLKSGLSPKTQTLWNNKKFNFYIHLRSKENLSLDKRQNICKLTGNDKLIEIIKELKFENECLRKIMKDMSIIC